MSPLGFLPVPLGMSSCKDLLNLELPITSSGRRLSVSKANPRKVELRVGGRERGIP